ncbi:MAG: radical SAM protein [Deltaproteobacteria bacterium]|nr:radical SAM protein [Deltaproteobacteria bacterium]
MKEPSFNDIIQNAMEKSIPLTAHVTLTQRCDLNCTHCYLPSRRSGEDLGVEEFDDILGQLREAGTLFITLSGGECLVHPDFFRMAALVRKHDLALRVYTNGNRLDERAARRIAQLHPMEVDVSLYGATAAVHDAVTRVAGSFDRAVRAIRNLVGFGVRVRIKAPIMRVNFDQIEELKDMAGSLGADLQASPYIYPPQGDAARCDTISCGGPELARVFEVLDPEGPPPPETASLGGGETGGADERDSDARGLCGAGNNFVAIGFDGSVYPCPMFTRPVGNLRDERFEDIWRNAALLKTLRGLSRGDLDGCRTCEVRDLCVRCVASAFEATDSLYEPDPRACVIARARGARR